MTDIELSLYADRLEIVSPGRLPNTVTVEKMRTGCRASRNELTRDVLRDYRYIEASGLGVPRKIVAGMRAHNGTDPDLIEEDYSFTVRRRTPKMSRNLLQKLCGSPFFVRLVGPLTAAARVRISCKDSLIFPRRS